jgi:hypothetical protein
VGAPRAAPGTKLVNPRLAPTPGQTATEAAHADTDLVVKLVIDYMRATQNGKPTSLKPYCKPVLDNFYGKLGISREAAEKDIADYYKTWPNQTTYFDSAQCQVEQKESDSFSVSLPFSWTASDGKKSKHGVSRLRALIYRTADGRFLIGAVSNER